ncbi:hypothetical protein Lal_00000757 [Lupinus albus]|nr:hypothetical protein Lal_00000757 [Lupinus albus]
MKACGEIVKDQPIIEKILRTLTLKYDHIVVAIEESKNLECYKIEELQSSLEAHEQRFKERHRVNGIRTKRARIDGRMRSGEIANT